MVVATPTFVVGQQSESLVGVEQWSLTFSTVGVEHSFASNITVTFKLLMINLKSHTKQIILQKSVSS